MRWTLPPPTRPAALQRTPDGAAELGCDAPAAARRHAACRATRAPLDTPRRVAADQGQRAAREDHETGPGRHRAGRVLAGAAGEVASPLHITGCCTHARQSFASSLPPGMRATPVMSCAHSAPARGIGSGYRAHAPPIPRLVRTRSTGCARHEVRRAARAVMELAPARPPSAPRGGSLALSTVLAQRSAVLAASRVRFAASRP